MASATLPSSHCMRATCQQGSDARCAVSSNSSSGGVPFGAAARQGLRLAAAGRAGSSFGGSGGGSFGGGSSQSGQSGRAEARGMRLRVQALAEEEIDIDGEAIADDYYSILGLTSDATPDEIKKAYYACMKACHPDLSGNNPDSVAFCSFINEVYEVLSDPEMRLVYDEIKGYSLTSVNPFMDNRHEKDQVFVDEFTCIGCKNCANTAEETFEIEEMWGRARVCNQGGNPPEKVQEAVETCPVSCIHWVTSPQLALLEDEMRRMERVSVAIMQAQSSRGADVFMQANSRWEKRRMRALAKAKVQAEREGRKDKYSKPLWETMGEAMGMRGEDTAWRGDSEDVYDKAATGAPVNQEKVRRAAAAARRWREYSRQGVDRRRKLYIAAESGGEEESEGEEGSEDGSEEGKEREGKQAEERDREPVAL